MLQLLLINLEIILLIYTKQMIMERVGPLLQKVLIKIIIQELLELIKKDQVFYMQEQNGGCLFLSTMEIVGNHSN